MPRDMGLIWKILEYASKNDINVLGDMDFPKFEKYEDTQVEHHVKLCEEAGFIETNRNRQNQCIITGIKRVTWNGYEALEGRKGRRA